MISTGFRVSCDSLPVLYFLLPDSYLLVSCDYLPDLYFLSWRAHQQMISSKLPAIISHFAATNVGRRTISQRVKSDLMPRIRWTTFCIHTSVGAAIIVQRYGIQFSGIVDIDTIR